MASVSKEAIIDASPDAVWEALRDFGAVHERLARGFVVDCKLDADDDRARTVTFVNGAVARELLVGWDDASRRLCYTVVEGPLDSTHHNAAAQVFPVDEGTRSRFVWVTDVLPDETAEQVEPLMDLGLAHIKRTLES